MLFKKIQMSVWFVGYLCFSSLLVANDISVNYSSEISLSTLTEGIYQRHPARLNESAQQDQVSANSKIADAFFADAATVLLSHRNDVIGSSDGLQEWEGVVELPLWISGQKQQQLTLSKTMSAELPSYQRQIKLEASAIVRGLVWKVMQADTSSQQAKQVWQAALRLSEDVTARVEAGDLAETERLLASGHTLEMQSEYLLAQADLKHALMLYRNLTGQVNLPQTYTEILSGNVKETALARSHPQLQLYDQRIATLRAQQGLARFEDAKNTNLFFDAKSERETDDQDFIHSVGVGISFALDDTVYRQPKVTAATRALADVEVERQQIARDLKIQLFSQQHELKTTRQQLELITQKNIITQQYLALQQRAFDLGEIDLVGLLRSQIIASRTQSRKQMLEVNINYMIANVNQALGVIL